MSHSKSKSLRNRKIGAAVLAGALAVASLGLAVGTAAASTGPVTAPTETHASASQHPA
ncbi:hypothetical protein V2W30_15415 [Streptomyces sp. Q6]|uniref:Uncharacterized protein n=1 Tax=Streptomyces citrinus TaxID=3118173 RepID=A0ACD5ABJ4_9ACTN